jgi:hypothetical protein
MLAEQQTGILAGASAIGAVTEENYGTGDERQNESRESLRCAKDEGFRRRGALACARVDLSRWKSEEFQVLGESAALAALFHVGQGRQSRPPRFSRPAATHASRGAARTAATGNRSPDGHIRSRDRNSRSAGRIPAASGPSPGRHLAPVGLFPGPELTAAPGNERAFRKRRTSFPRGVFRWRIR